VVLVVTCLPTIVELLLPRIGTNVQAAAFLVFGFSAVDAVTDWPRVHMVMQAYQGYFSQWGVLGYGLWYVCHIPLLLFATFLFELLFVLCIVLIAVLLLKVMSNEHALKQQVKEAHV
jgi:hypothetical protein